MEQSIIYVGLDVHKDTIAVALAEAGLREEVREHGKIANSPAALKALTEKLAEPAPPPQPAPTVSGAWRQTLAAWLAEHKTYPDEARRQGIEGSVTLRFTVDRSGHVIDVMVLRGSGSRILDSAAEAMLSNAMLPPPVPAIQDREPSQRVMKRPSVPSWACSAWLQRWTGSSIAKNLRTNRP